MGMISFFRGLSQRQREIWRMLRWQVDHERLRQHGIELPGEAEGAWTGRFEIVRMRLSGIRRRWGGKLVPLTDTMLVRYLRSGDSGVLAEYERLHCANGLCAEGHLAAWRAHTLETFASLAESDYDPGKSCIVVDADGAIVDGYHRCASLFVRQGPDCEVTVIRII